MKIRAVLFFGLAFLLALGTAYVARLWAAQDRMPPLLVAAAPERPSSFVLVAASDLGMGSFLRPTDLRWQAWPDDQLSEAYLRRPQGSDAAPDPIAALLGSVVRSRIAAGEPVTFGRVIKPGDRGFLAAVLSLGMRAVAVPVTATSGVAGFVFPGDRVDLILSHAIKDERNPSAPAKQASETVLTDIRVLAVDQATADQENKPMLAKTMTFEVTPKQVEAIGVMSALGTLSLSLRSLERAEDSSGSAEDGSRVRALSHTIDSDVSPLIRHGVPKSGTAGVTVLRGGGSNSAHVVRAGATAAGEGDK